MWSSNSFLVSAVILFSFPKSALSFGTPFGLATGTTGGGNATPAVPSSLAQLTTWLSDNTPRVILLDKIFDFTNAEGTVTGNGCQPWTCSPNPQVLDKFSCSMPKINILFSWLLTPTVVSMRPISMLFLVKPFGPGCDNYQPKAPKTTITYYKAGTTPLKVTSNKTLLGKGSNGGM
jgi:pectin lyase